MFRLTSNISIGDYTFRGVVNLEVASSWDEFTDKCSITIPRKLNWQGMPVATGSNPLLQRGDEVNVQIGYDDENESIFQGYVHQISAEIPVRIECQDAMWRLKQTTVTSSYKAVKLEELLSDILPEGIDFEAFDVELGPYRISQATPVQVLEDLKKTYFLKSWFRDGKLYCGFAYVPSLQSTHVIRMERNVVDNQLEYFRKEDIKIRLKMVSMKSDNSKVEYDAGDSDGEQRTMYYYGKTLAELKAIADEEIDRLRYEGYRGSLTTFGKPTVRHGDVVDLRSDAYPERDGEYLVREVRYEFGMNGYRQEINLDSKI